MTTEIARSAAPADVRTQPGSRPGALLAVLGGKGGVGKTNLATNVSIAAAGLGARVLLVDGDLGLANVDVLLGMVPRFTAAEILSGECSFADAITTGPGGIHVVLAATARMDLAASRPAELTSLLAPLLASGSIYDLVIVDVGAGIGPAALTVTSVCDRAWLVTTPEPTSLTDAYATLKVLRRTAANLPVELVVNAVRDELQARSAHTLLEKMSRRFLEHEIPLRGWVPRDPHVEDAVAAQRAVVQSHPMSPAARRMVGLASDLISAAGSTSTARWKRVSQ